MPVKCTKCLVELVASEVVAKCVECKLEFHPSCTRLGSSQNYTKNKYRTWKCDTCKDETSSTTSTRSAEDTLEDKRSILEAIASMKSVLISSMEIKIDEVNASISTLSEDIRAIKSSISSLDENQCKLNTRCDELKQENERLCIETRELKFQLLDLEQHSRASNLEISGIPLTQAENVGEIMCRIASIIQVPFKIEDVSMAHRLRLYSKKHAHPPIIAQFVSRSIREAWLAAIRSKRVILASQISNSFPATKVFINDHLTPSNKALLGMARRLRREGKIHFAGFVNGKVLIKPKEGDAAIRVQAIEDMDKYSTSK